MKLLAATVSGAMLIAGGAAAQGIALFGDARLGLGYNIDNENGQACGACKGGSHGCLL